MSEWTSYTLGDVTNNFDSVRIPVKSAERTAGPYPYYGASGIVDHVSEYLFLGDYLLIAEDGENLRTRKTPIAFMATGKFWVNNHAHVVQGNHLANTRFLCYRLALTDISGHLSGSTQPKLTQASMNSIKVALPDRGQQDAIVELLGALDDKIAVNERIAATTDQLVSSMFSVLLGGAPPVEEGRLGDVATVNSRSVKPAREGSVRYVDISAVGTGSYAWPDRIAWSDAPGRARRLAPVGSTIWSTVRPNRRSHALVLDTDDDLVFSTGLAVLTPVSVGPAFLYEATRTPEFQTYLEGVAEGSAYPAVRAERFKGAPLPLPEATAREEFEEAAMALRRRAHLAAVESRTLASLRDTLLPQLMSGRLCVRDAEKIVEDHV
ncbi:restriction endonuclease subunit S [Streptomyces cinereoruber]|uniref:restriction endonuclease subunit S n=1 Tax=Streptomyces cinereoruber TaxID=67260 RepID=UPI003C2C0F67